MHIYFYFGIVSMDVEMNAVILHVVSELFSLHGIMFLTTIELSRFLFPDDFPLAQETQYCG